MSNKSKSSWTNLRYDLPAGFVTALVALPLCIGIAKASGAPVFAGLLAGVIGGIIVGAISQSQTSVTGPAAAMIAIVATQIQTLGSFETFLLAVFISGLLQIALGVLKAGELSAFFPSSVVKGLLAAIGVILILKQIPHLAGRDANPEGAMAFDQPNEQNTFTELLEVVTGNVHPGALCVGLVCLAVLLIWDRFESLKKLVIPGPLVATLVGVGLMTAFQSLGGSWTIGPTHLVDIQLPQEGQSWASFLTGPDFSQILNPSVYSGAITIALIGSLATLLNLEAVDKLDPQKRKSPASRELMAQGVGNAVSGLVGGIPMTSVVIRGSISVSAGSKTKTAAIVHGILVCVSVVFFAQYLNMIPLSALAAILIVTGFKLASPMLFKQMWEQGKYQFLPFILTIAAIVLTDVLTGVLIGLGLGLVFVLVSNIRQPIRLIREKHIHGEVLHVMLANQVSFLKRAAMDRTLNTVQDESRLLIDATDTDFIDPDVLALIREFRDDIAPQRGITVELKGFHEDYQLGNVVQFVDYSTRELLDGMTPDQAIETLREGNLRFQNGRRLSRDLNRQVIATSEGQHPFAAVLSCIDSRVPAEIVFDMGIGEMFSVRVAGNVLGANLLGSLEYAAIVSGVKVIVVMGHRRCGAVNASLNLLHKQTDVAGETGCPHLSVIVEEFRPQISEDERRRFLQLDACARDSFADEVAERNVRHVVEQIKVRSQSIGAAVEAGTLRVVGAFYDVDNSSVRFLDSPQNPLRND